MTDRIIDHGLNHMIKIEDPNKVMESKDEIFENYTVPRLWDILQSYNQKQKTKKGNFFLIKVEIIASKVDHPNQNESNCKITSSIRKSKIPFFLLTFPDQGITSNPMNKYTCWIRNHTKGKATKIKKNKESSEAENRTC